MAGKKKKNAGRPKAPAQEETVTANTEGPMETEVPVEETAADGVQETDADTGVVDLPSDVQAPPEVSSLQDENETLKRELEELKSILAAKDSEIEQLKQKVEEARVQPPAVEATAKSGTEVAALQERLAQLKKDQLEADAARDSAWAELKRCVQEVAKLANAGLKESQSITSS